MSTRYMLLLGGILLSTSLANPWPTLPWTYGAPHHVSTHLVTTLPPAYQCIHTSPSIHLIRCPSLSSSLDSRELQGHHWFVEVVRVRACLTWTSAILTLLHIKGRWPTAKWASWHSSKQVGNKACAPHHSHCPVAYTSKPNLEPPILGATVAGYTNLKESGSLQNTAMSVTR